MGFRLKTSKKTKEIFEEIGRSSNLKPFALSKIAVSLSLKSDTPLSEEERDSNGLELQRSTVTGEFDSIFKALIEMDLGRNIDDDEYYPKYMKLGLVISMISLFILMGYIIYKNKTIKKDKFIV